jgi:hypothetical protein
MTMEQQSQRMTH